MGFFLESNQINVKIYIFIYILTCSYPSSQAGARWPERRPHRSASRYWRLGTELASQYNNSSCFLHALPMAGVVPCRVVLRPSQTHFQTRPVHERREYWRWVPGAGRHRVNLWLGQAGRPCRDMEWKRKENRKYIWDIWISVRIWSAFTIRDRNKKSIYSKYLNPNMYESNLLPSRQPNTKKKLPNLGVPAPKQSVCLSLLCPALFFSFQRKSFSEETVPTLGL